MSKTQQKHDAAGNRTNVTEIGVETNTLTYTVNALNQYTQVAVGSADARAHYPLDEGSGSTAADASGHGNNGTVDATATWIEGVASNALRFAGVNFSAVEAAAASSLDFSNALTFAVWVQATNSADRGLGSYRAHEYDSGWRVFYSTQRVLFQWATDGVLWSLDRSGSFPSNQWVHVAATYNNGTVRFYVDGHRTDTITKSYVMGTNTSRYTLGNTADMAHPLDGQMDDTRLYAHQLSDAEIMTLTQARDYSYDANGNLTSDRVWTYEYDPENRLVAAAVPGGSLRVDYRYDAFGRLIERRASGSSASTNRLYYAGWQLIAEYNGSGTLQRKYVYGPGIDEPVRMRFAGGAGTHYYYHADGLGSVTEITTSTGTKTESYTYDVYGTPTIYNAAGSVISTPSTGNRLLFTGRDRDPDTTLYNYRYRYYSPSLGRFVQVDPIGLASDELNLYRYGNNNPALLVDPYGLRWWDSLLPPAGSYMRRFLIRIVVPGYLALSGLAAVWGWMVGSQQLNVCDALSNGQSYVMSIIPGMLCVVITKDCHGICSFQYVWGWCYSGLLPAPEST